MALMHALILIGLLVASISCQLTLPLHHLSAKHEQKRHSLALKHQQKTIRHDMRNFKGIHQRSLTHQQKSLQSYNLTDMGYYFTLHLIVANISYNLNVDTGSSDLFIKGEQSAGTPTVKYTCAQCLSDNRKYMIGYLDGQLDTYLAKLPVQLGPHTFEEYVLVAYRADSNFETCEGIVGLSFPRIAQNPNPTFIQTLIDNKIIDTYAFGVNLNFQQHNHSFISFGQPDTSHYEGVLHKYNILSSYMYTIGINGLSVGDSRKFPISVGLIDTGTTCISIPEYYESQILKQFNKNTQVNNCAFDLETFAPQFSLLRCVVRDFSVLPSFKVYIGQQVYEIDKDVYFQNCELDGDLSLCDLLIQSVKFEYQLFMGDGFVSRFYVYFDITNREIGIAKNREELSYKNSYKPISILDDEDIAFFAALK